MVVVVVVVVVVKCLRGKTGNLMRPTGNSGRESSRMADFFEGATL